MRGGNRSNYRSAALYRLHEFVDALRAVLGYDPLYEPEDDGERAEQRRRKRAEYQRRRRETGEQ